MLRSLLLAAALLTPALLSAAAPVQHPRYGSWGVDTADMAQNARPGDGFYDYVEGTWLRAHAIPADKVGAGYNYDLPDEIELQVRHMVESVAANPTTPIARKIGDAYAAWMDEKGIEARGLAPLKPYLARIDAVKTRNQLVALMMQPAYASPVNIGISNDQDDPTHYTAAAGQARLGLPTRDYYLLTGEKYDKIRAAYRAYVVHIQQLAGLPDAAARADRIIALETSLAKDQWTPERRRDPIATHNPMTRAPQVERGPRWTRAPA